MILSIKLYINHRISFPSYIRNVYAELNVGFAKFPFV